MCECAWINEVIEFREVEADAVYHYPTHAVFSIALESCLVIMVQKADK